MTSMFTVGQTRAIINFRVALSHVKLNAINIQNRSILIDDTVWNNIRMVRNIIPLWSKQNSTREHVHLLDLFFNYTT